MKNYPFPSLSHSPGSASAVHSGRGEQDRHGHTEPSPLQRDGGALRGGRRQHGVEGDGQVIALNEEYFKDLKIIFDNQYKI